MQKEERNAEIRRMWETGRYTQQKIGDLFQITQCRVNAIIHHRHPKYSYCRKCGTRIAYRVSICDKCRGDGVAARAAKQEAKKKAKELRVMQYQTALAMIKDFDELIRTDRKETKAQKKKRIELLNTLRRRARLQTNYLEIEAKKWRIHEWQQQGRDNTRFKVRLRDNFTCQSCGLIRTPNDVESVNAPIRKTGTRKGTIKSLDVHHIGGVCGQKSRGYDSTKDLTKLITLCHSCHYKRHDHSQVILGNYTPKNAVKAI